MRDDVTNELGHLPWLVWAGWAIALVGFVHWQLGSLREGTLFVLALPGEPPPTAVEIDDAAATATALRWHALAVMLPVSVAATYVVVTFSTSRADGSWSLRSVGWRAAAVVFLLATVADLTTTITFFHTLGVDRELHPAIRLFGYAFGRTMGPIAGKSVQAVGVLSIATVSTRHGTPLLCFASLVCLLAAGHNAALW